MFGNFAFWLGILFSSSVRPLKGAWMCIAIMCSRTLPKQKKANGNNTLLDAADANIRPNMMQYHIVAAAVLQITWPTLSHSLLTSALAHFHFHYVGFQDHAEKKA